MTGRPTIRPLAPAELDAVLELSAELDAGERDPHDPAAKRRALELLLRRPDLGAVLVAALDGRPVGYAVGTLGLALEVGGLFLLVDELYVEPALRGSGLGRALLQRLVAWGRAAGCRQVDLEVGWENRPAQDWYARLGFERHRRHYCSVPLDELERRLGSGD